MNYLAIFWSKLRSFFIAFCNKPPYKIYIPSFLAVFIIFCYFFFIIWQPPVSFPGGSLYQISEGVGLSQTATNLRDKNIIKSKFWFKTFVVLFAGPKGLTAGDYVLSHNQAVFTIAYRFSHSDYELEPIRITVREGQNVYEVAELIFENISLINKEEFVAEAGKYEGYLFPDTYYFLPNAKDTLIIKAMRENFNSKIFALNDEINTFDKPLGDIIKMASIIEKEGRLMEDKQIISGILWKRISINMPLQVDSSFKYINGKITDNLTLADLKIDSPYNSYIYKGLPPTPIANPGLDSIMATIRPIETDYLYFLSDDGGDMHYAETYKKHLQNKELYLD